MGKKLKTAIRIVDRHIEYYRNIQVRTTDITRVRDCEIALDALRLLKRDAVDGRSSL